MCVSFRLFRSETVWVRREREREKEHVSEEQEREREKVCVCVCVVRRGEHLQGICFQSFANPWVALALPRTHMLSLSRPRMGAVLARELSPTRTNILRLARRG